MTCMTQQSCIFSCIPFHCIKSIKFCTLFWQYFTTECALAILLHHLFQFEDPPLCGFTTFIVLQSYVNITPDGPSKIRVFFTCSGNFYPYILENCLRFLALIIANPPVG